MVGCLVGHSSSGEVSTPSEYRALDRPAFLNPLPPRPALLAEVHPIFEIGGTRGSWSCKLVQRSSISCTSAKTRNTGLNPSLAAPNPSHGGRPPGETTKGQFGTSSSSSASSSSSENIPLRFWEEQTNTAAGTGSETRIVTFSRPSTSSRSQPVRTPAISRHPDSASKILK